VLLVSPAGRTNVTSRRGAAALDAALDAAFPGCAAARCRLSLRGAEWAEPARSGDDNGDDEDGAEARGALQATLVNFLQRCPGGLVVLHDAHALPPAALPALLPLLSEAGGYTRAGRPVSAVRASAVLTARLSGYDGRWEADEEGLRRGAKRALQAAMTRAAAAAGAAHGPLAEEAARNVAAALRRRVDDVAPLRDKLREERAA
jgi:hypothetical protein